MDYTGEEPCDCGTQAAVLPNTYSMTVTTYGKTKQIELLGEKPLPRDYGTVRYARPPISRNATCPCGSGKKFKQCGLVGKCERRTQ